MEILSFEKAVRVLCWDNFFGQYKHLLVFVLFLLVLLRQLYDFTTFIVKIIGFIRVSNDFDYKCCEIIELSE